jgi:signal transduction histidine kinase
VLLAGIWSLALLITAGAGLTLLFHRAAERRLDYDLTEVLDNLLTGTTVDDEGHLVAPPLTDPRALRAYSGRYWSIASYSNHTWTMVERSRSLWDSELRAPAGGADVVARNNGQTIHYDSQGPHGQSVRVAAMQAELTGFPHPVVFIAAETREPIDADSRTFALITAGAVGVLSIGLMIAVIIQVRVGLSPLFALRREVADVRTGRKERLVSDYPAELEPLANELNALVAHNQEVVERQRTHVGNLAHALKTPISVMMTEAGLHDGPLSGVVSQQTRIMQAQVDHHLRRARAAARSQQSGERTSVAEVLDEMSRALERINRDKGVTIEWDADDELHFAGERQDFMEVAGNLMENACKWCRKRVNIEAEAAGGGRLRLVIEDDGPGLPADQRATVLRRGERLDENAPGSGLGLSIVSELTKAYGGAVALDVSRWGGLKVEVTLPMAE